MRLAKASGKAFIKKKAGRTPGWGTQLGMRWSNHELTAIDIWRRKQPEELSRTEAIRRLVELGLKAAPRRGKR